MVGHRLAALLAVVIVFGWASPAATQQPSARTFLDRNPVAVHQQFTLSLEVSGVQRLDSDPQFPQLDQFARYLRQSSSTNIVNVNGRTTISFTIQAQFLATREGEFQIPSVTVVAAGSVLQTQPLTLTVTAAPQGRGSGGAGSQGAVGLAPEDLFLVASASKRSVYENEPLIVEYRIFTRVNIESYTLLSPSSIEGFWVEEIPMTDGPAVEQVDRNGIRYTSAVLRRVALFPTGPGTRAIEPMTVEARVRVPRRGGIFDDIFGGSLLGQLAPVTVSSQPVEIEVSALPAAGRPETFTGVVGSLSIEASVDRTELEANDALTLTVRVSGEGNLRGLTPPKLDLAADFEVFEPEVSENITPVGGVVRGSKTYEYVLIPRAPGTRSIPALELSYFNTSDNRYATARTEPITLEVTGDTPLLIGSGLRAGVETLREDIRFIRDGGGPPRPAPRPLPTSSGFWIVAILPLLATAGALGIRSHRDRLEGDLAYARGRRAGRVAKRRLGHARDRVGDPDSRAFYAEVTKALQGFLADKLNISAAGLMTDQAAETLQDRDVPEDVANRYLACLERCDRQRFAPAPPAPGEQSDFLAQAEEAMTDLNQRLRR